MSQQFFKRQLPLLVIATALVGLVAWKEDQSATAKFQNSDTTPDNRQKKVREFDDVQRELERAQVEMEKAFKDFKMPEVPDMQKIMADVQASMKEIDIEKMKAQVEASLKSINTEEMKATVAEAMKDIDAAKIKAETEAALAKVNMEEINAEMEKIKQVDFAQLEADMKKLKPEIEASLKKAKVEIEKAKEDIKEFKAFEEGLAKDGLIKKEVYTVEHADGKLIINGKVQDEAIYNKYRSFLEKHKKFTIKKTDDDLNVDMD